jgi:phage terminase large subunit-like protein
LPSAPAKPKRRKAAKRARQRSPAKYPHVAKGLAYARDIVKGRIPACRWVRLACQRHLDDLRASKATWRKRSPWVFDQVKAEWACEFAELLPHVKGHWAIAQPGDPKSNRIRLEPWQCFVRMVQWGWVARATGLRRFGRSYLEVPRKNGKSVIAAVDGLKMLADDGEHGAEVYSGATSEKQAWEVFRPARLMALNSPEYQEHYGVQVNAQSLTILANGSRFEPVIGKPGDGASPSHAIVDEYHEHPDSTLYDTMVTGMGARRQPLLEVITTAGDNLAGPCYAFREEVCRMLDGTQPNDRLFGIIYTIDEADDWTSEEALIKANPNFGVSVGGEWLKEQQREATQDARKQNIFKTKHLNLWVASRSPWMNMEWWHRQKDSNLRPEDFYGEPCFGAGDLASKIDLAATTRIFRRMIEGKPHFFVFTRHYLPSETVKDPANRHYQAWEHEGLLTVTDGERIDQDRIRDDLVADGKAHGYEVLAFDEWGAQGLATDLEAEGLQVIFVPMNVKHLSNPMKEVEALVKAGQFHHDGNPILDWEISNVTCKEDPNGNIFPRKESKERKIDAVIALLMAMSRAILPAEDSGSVVEFG